MELKSPMHFCATYPPMRDVDIKELCQRHLFICCLAARHKSSSMCDIMLGNDIMSKEYIDKPQDLAMFVQPSWLS